MHPLLTPNTHADLEILARNLSASGYYENQQEAYLKMFMGVTLGLTALESLHGLNLKGQHVIVKTPLVERIILRSGVYSISRTPSETACILKFLKSGQKQGELKIDQAEFNPPLNPQDLYGLTLAKGARLYFPDLFGHKFSTELEFDIAERAKSSLEQKVQAVKEQVPAMTTADQVEPKRSYTKLEQAENAKALTDWQSAVDGLAAGAPGDWDDHAKKLEKLDFLKRSELASLFDKYKQHAKAKGLGYNSVTLKFYELNYQPHTAYQPEAV